MNKNQRRKYRKLLNSLSTEQRFNLDVMNDYVVDQKKKNVLEGLPVEDKETILAVLSCITYASEHDVKKLRSKKLYQKVYALLIDSKESGSISPELHEIYKKQWGFSKNYLHLKKGRLIKSILGGAAVGYSKLKRKNLEKAKLILDNCLIRASDIQKEHLKILDDLLILHEGYPMYLRLTSALLKTNIHEVDHLGLAAAIITNPKLQLLQLIKLDEEWNSFPLKWYANQLPTTTCRDLFESFKNGDDLSEVFISNYLNDEFKSLHEVLSSKYISAPISHVLCSRLHVIQDVLACFKKKIYSASICTSLTVIEGVLWDFSKEYNYISDVKIYVDSACTTLLLLNGNTMKDFTIGNVLRQTALQHYFDKNFISYFCDELYKERNPILHGQDTESFTAENSAKKIATLEYLLRSIEKFNKKETMARIEKNIPAIIKEKIISV